MQREIAEIIQASNQVAGGDQQVQIEVLATLLHNHRVLSARLLREKLARTLKENADKDCWAAQVKADIPGGL